MLAAISPALLEVLTVNNRQEREVRWPRPQLQRSHYVTQQSLRNVSCLSSSANGVQVGQVSAHLPAPSLPLMDTAIAQRGEPGESSQGAEKSKYSLVATDRSAEERGTRTGAER